MSNHNSKTKKNNNQRQNEQNGSRPNNKSNNTKSNSDKFNNGKPYNESKRVNSPNANSMVKNKSKVITKINRDYIENKEKFEQEYYKKREEKEKMAEETEELETVKSSKQIEKEQEQKVSEKETATDLKTEEKPVCKSVIHTDKVEEKLESKKDEKDEEKQEKIKTADAEDKKDKRPSKIELKDKSELFKQMIDIVLVCEKIEDEKNRLKEKNKILTLANKELQEDKESLSGNLEATELLCKKKQSEIDELKSDVEHRNEVINIVKANKSESEQEFKNALAASLRSFYVDFDELRGMEMSEDVGLAIVETMDGVFKILEKNGIKIQK